LFVYLSVKEIKNMKKFKIVATIPAGVFREYEVEAKNETEAIELLKNGSYTPTFKYTILYDQDTEYDYPKEV